MDELGYHIVYKVIDGQAWVPQHRERIIIVGFREKNDFSFDQMVVPEQKRVLKDILHPEDGSEDAGYHRERDAREGHAAGDGRD